MRRTWMMALVLVAGLVTGCDNYVTRAEFDTYKADVKTSGDAVDTWIAAAHANIMFLRQKVIAKLCTVQDPCDPPAAPPSPPPDGGWGS